MEHNIGEEFNVILRVKTKEGLGSAYDCNRCAMGSVCSGTHNSVSPCANTDRQDGIDVYFDSVSVKDENEMKQQENMPEENTNNANTNDSLDLAKILKHCPKGWRFYTDVYDEVTFGGFSDLVYQIYINTKNNGVKLLNEKGEEIIGNGKCILFPSKDQRDWSKFTAPWYNPDAQSEQKVEYWAKIERFDVSTLKPFDKVLVRDNPEDEWMIGFFSHISGCNKVCDSLSWSFVIPYNDETKHLVGTSEEAPEYYRI